MKALVLAVLFVAACGGGGASVKKRTLPDYDGRPPPGKTAGDVLIWIPRALASPLYVVSEYGVRRPMRWLVVTGERKQWSTRVADVVGGKKSIGPTFLIDTGFSPTVGLYYFNNDAFVPDNDLRATVSVGPRSATATITDRYTFGDNMLAGRLHFNQRNDSLYFGTGPRTEDEDAGRYEVRRLAASVFGERRLGGFARLRADAGFQWMRFDSVACCDDPGVLDQVAMGNVDMPAQFAGVSGPFSRLRFTVDTRDKLPATGAGFFLELEHGTDLDDRESWLAANATASASVDVTGRKRVVGVILTARTADPIGDGEVPFVDLATLGGSGPMPGFKSARLLGRSALAARLEYEWPLWVWLGGVVHVATGNAFGERFEGFEPGLLRLSFGMGFRSINTADHRFELTVAAGTDTFDDGGRIDSIRLVFGGTTGF